jgi:hypothetical protein
MPTPPSANDPAEVLSQLAHIGRRLDTADRRAGVQERLNRELQDTIAALAEGHGEVEDLKQIVAGLSENVAALAESVNPAGDPGPPVVSFMLERNQEIATLAAADLEMWLAEVYQQYPDPLPACWPYHPWVVEELLALRRAHHAAYKPKAPRHLDVDWHANDRPGVVERIQRGVRCLNLEDHFDAQPAPGVPLRGALRRIVEVWVTPTAGAARSLPTPTAAEVAEAEAYADARIARATH